MPLRCTAHVLESLHLEGVQFCLLAALVLD